MASPVINVDASPVAATTTDHTIGAATTSTSGAPIYVVLHMNDPYADTDVTPQTGFSHVVTAGDGAGSTPSVLVYEKTSSGSESGNYVFTLNASGFGYIESFWLSGADESDPLPAAHIASTFDNNSVSSINAPSVTTGRDECRVYRAAYFRVSGADPVFTGLTELMGMVRATSAHEEAATAGATGTATATASASDVACALTLAFQPPDAATGPLLESNLLRSPLLHSRLVR